MTYLDEKEWSKNVLSEALTNQFLKYGPASDWVFQTGEVKWGPQIHLFSFEILDSNFPEELYESMRKFDPKLFLFNEYFASKFIIITKEEFERQMNTKKE